jgi:hypothetical protein
LCLLFTILGALGLNLTTSALQNAGNNLVLLHSEPASFMQNPAFFSSGVQTGATYLFNMSSIPYYNFNLNTKIYKNNVAISMASLGSGIYQENQATLGYSLSYKKLAAGFNLRFLQTNISGHNKFSSHLTDLAFGWNDEEFSSYFCWKNVTGSSYKNSKLPVVLSWEGCWQATEVGKLSFGLEKEAGFDFSYRMGMSYNVVLPLKLICSYQYQPDRLGGGFVIEHKNWDVSYGVRTHQYLSLTHFISLAYGF